MSKNDERNILEHLFRIEYGKIVAVVTGYLGLKNLTLAEDIAQETFYKAVKNWGLNGIPPNPKAWLYVTAKHEGINALKKYKKEIATEFGHNEFNITELNELSFTEDLISDEQLKMMFVCCDPNISSETQIALILKMLCGFSQSEIAHAFFTSTETINKRLVRGRKKLRELNITFTTPNKLEERISAVLHAIYLLFNEGYLPSEKESLIRSELCKEAIRLAEILIENKTITQKSNAYALLGLMYLNAARFSARWNDQLEAIEMKDQDRSKWNKAFIDIGILHLEQASMDNTLSIYHILATISANHCIAPSFEDTNWEEIHHLYNALLELVDAPIIRLNRCVATARVSGNEAALNELERIQNHEAMQDNYLFHATKASVHLDACQPNLAEKHFRRALELTTNPRNINLLQKKLVQVVPV